MIKKIFYTCPHCGATFPEKELKCWSSPEDDFGVVEESKIRTYLILSALHGITVKP